VNNVTNPSAKGGVNVMKVIYALWGCGARFAEDAEKALDRLLDMLVPIQPIQLEDEV
jgi:hypothetical protein